MLEWRDTTTTKFTAAKFDSSLGLDFSFIVVIWHIVDGENELAFIASNKCNK